MTHLQAGVAKADITPPVGIAHAGWGAQTHERAAGVDMPFTVSALSLRKGGTAAMVVDLDLGTISVTDADRIRSEVEAAVGTPAANVRVSYSHTHAGAVMSSFGAYIAAGQELIEGYRQTIVTQTVAAARAAVAAEVPSRVVAGAGRSDVAVNRRLTVDDRVLVGLNPGGVSDDRVFVTRIDALVGAPVAAIVGYACHPITLAFQNDLLSPDFPGVVREVVADLTGAPCLFLQGCAGDVMPTEALTGDTSVHRRLGTMLAAEAARVFLGLESRPGTWEFDGVVESGAPLGMHRWVPGDASDQGLAVSNRTIRMPVRPTPPPSEAAATAAAAVERVATLRAAGAPDAELKDATFRAKRTAMRSQWASWADGAEDVEVTLHGIAVGDVALVGFPGEPFSAIGMQVHAESPFPHTHMAGYSNGWLGYVPTADAFGPGGYEVDTGSTYGPDGADVLRRESLELLADLKSALGEGS